MTSLPLRCTMLPDEHVAVWPAQRGRCSGGAARFCAAPAHPVPRLLCRVLGAASSRAGLQQQRAARCPAYYEQGVSRMGHGHWSEGVPHRELAQLPAAVQLVSCGQTQCSRYARA